MAARSARGRVSRAPHGARPGRAGEGGGRSGRRPRPLRPERGKAGPLLAPRTLPSPLAEAAGAVDGEGAPPGGPSEQAATMRVNEKYSTLPAEDRSVHIINICAIEDIGYLPSEGTVSAGGRDRAGRAAHLRRAPRAAVGRRRGLAWLPGALSVPRGGRPPAHVRRPESAAARPSAPVRGAAPTPETQRPGAASPLAARSAWPRAGAGTLPSRPGPGCRWGQRGWR